MTIQRMIAKWFARTAPPILRRPLSQPISVYELVAFGAGVVMGLAALYLGWILVSIYAS